MIKRIDADLKKALLGGDKIAVDTLRGLKNALNARQKELKRGLKENEIAAIISKELKKRREAAQAYRSAGAAQRAEKEEQEAKILSGYLPEQMSEEQIAAAVDKVIEKLGAEGPAQLGAVIATAVKELGARADSALIAKAAKEKLARK